MHFFPFTVVLYMLPISLYNILLPPVTISLLEQVHFFMIRWFRINDSQMLKWAL